MLNNYAKFHSKNNYSQEIDLFINRKIFPKKDRFSLELTLQRSAFAWVAHQNSGPVLHLSKSEYLESTSLGHTSKSWWTVKRKQLQINYALVLCIWYKSKRNQKNKRKKFNKSTIHGAAHLSTLYSQHILCLMKFSNLKIMTNNDKRPLLHHLNVNL